jgi:hypothetical protein
MFFGAGYISMFNKPGTGYLGRAIRRSLVAPDAPTIGAAYGGGFYAGRIATNGHLYNLVVAPKASGEALKTWGVYGTPTGITSVIDGPTNSASLAALGAPYQAAIYCEGLTIGGYSDWYLPAKNELGVLYYFLKPTTDNNIIADIDGSNANAVPPQPIITKHTSGSPAQTSSIGFRTGAADAFASASYWSASEHVSNYVWQQSFTHGRQFSMYFKTNEYYVRAVRRVLVY